MVTLIHPQLINRCSCLVSNGLICDKVVTLISERTHLIRAVPVFQSQRACDLQAPRGQTNVPGGQPHLTARAVPPPAHELPTPTLTLPHDTGSSRQAWDERVEGVEG